MSNVDQTSNQSSGPQQPMYVMYAPETDDTIGLAELIRILWQRKLLVIGVTSTVTLIAVVWVLLAIEWFRAETLLVPVDEERTPMLPGALGGIANLAGLNVRGSRSYEAQAVLQSRDLTRAFIEEQDLLPVLFSDRWDSVRKTWITDDPTNQPSLEDGVTYFSDVRSIREDPNTRLVTLAVEWTDAVTAAEWANQLVDLANDTMRNRALRDAEANVKYLQSEFSGTSVVTLQQSIGRLLESEMQKLMLARGSDEFAFRVVDRAVPPEQRSRPRRTLTVALSIVLGGLLSLLIVLGQRAIQRVRDTELRTQ